MSTVRDWQAFLLAAACLAAFGFGWWFSGYSSGFQAALSGQVDALDVVSWGTCTYGYSGWARCARTTDGRLVIVRGMK